MIIPMQDFGCGLGINPINSCCGPNTRTVGNLGTPYLKAVVNKTGGNPGSNLDEVATKGFFGDGDVITARVGTYYLNDWMLLIGAADGSEPFEVAPQDYDAGNNNVHWRLVAGNIP